MVGDESKEEGEECFESVEHQTQLIEAQQEQLCDATKCDEVANAAEARAVGAAQRGQAGGAD